MPCPVPHVEAKSSAVVGTRHAVSVRGDTSTSRAYASSAVVGTRHAVSARESINSKIDMNEQLPNRKSPRLGWHDYSEGAYFVTACTRHKVHYFGEIDDAKMRFSPIGESLDRAIREVNAHYEYAEVPLYVVMPNHFHAIIFVNQDSKHLREVVVPAWLQERRDLAACAAGFIPEASAVAGNLKPVFGGNPSLLAAVVGGIKAAVTRFAKANALPFEWQPRFHDHIIRSWHSPKSRAIYDYIENNPARWSSDCYNIK